MQSHLKMLILEQMHRCRKLESIIKYPIKPVELYTLAERCKSLLSGLYGNLEEQLYYVERATEKEHLRTIHIEFRKIRRDIDVIEQYGIAILKMHCDDLDYLNKLISTIHSESRIPLQLASVASFSSEFYFFAHKTNVIFMPAADHTSILNLPILYHELGHYISQKSADPRLKNTNRAYQDCVQIFTSYFTDELKRRLLESGPPAIKRRPIIMYENWKIWFEEFFSDCVATLLCGPAYAWTWLHTTAKFSVNPISYEDKTGLSHPSDEARFRVCKYCLEQTGFIEDLDLLNIKWSNFFPDESYIINTVYQQAYPDVILKKIVKEIYKGLKEDNFSIFSSGSMNDLPIVKALNEGWKMFWNCTNTFFTQEIEIIEKIKRSVNVMS